MSYQGIVAISYVVLCAENFLEWGPHDPNDIRSQSNVNPCMSTGYWFATPAQPVIEFLDAFIDLMLHWRDWQTDQRLWNEASFQWRPTSSKP